MNSKLFGALMALAIAPAALMAVSFEGQTTLPSYNDPTFMRDYFAPQPDWVPMTQIPQYNRNVRTPEITWVKYKGSYAPALRIRPIDPKWIEKEIEFGLIQYPQKAGYDEALEANANYRTVIVREMNEVNDFTNLTFKVKSEVKNTDAELVIKVHGPGLTFKTAECKDVKTEADGVKVYNFPVETKLRNKISGIDITVSPIKGKIEDAVQDITIFDFCFNRREAHPFVKGIAPRTFVRSECGDEVADIFDYIAKSGDDSKALPVTGWAPVDPVKDSGVKVTTVKEKINGEDVDALRIEWTTPTAEINPKTNLPKQRGARVAVPFANNALDFNTLSFLYKIEVSDGLPVCDHLELSRIPQYFYFDQYLDNPGVSFAADCDRFNWNFHAVTRSHLSQGKRTGKNVPNGWRFYAFDMVNDDPTGNKGFTFDKITSYEFTLQNSLIPAGKKVVFTIALPRVTRGLVYTGGDMALNKKFTEWKESYEPMPYKEALKQRPYKEGLMSEALPVMKDRIADLEIICSPYDRSSNEARDFSAKFLADNLSRVLTPLNTIRVLHAPSTNDNVKIFLGLLPPKVASEEAAAKIKEYGKRLAGTPGYYIMREGKKIYINGGAFGRRRYDKGIMNGVLDFLEYNFGIIFPREVVTRGKKTDNMAFDVIYPKERYEDYAFTWGEDYINIPIMNDWGFSYGSEKFAYLNRTSYFGCWYSQEAHNFASYRAYGANHWFGFGAGKDKELWGRRKDGTPYQPGCYTGSPCFVRVIDAGKNAFLAGKFVTVNDKTVARAGRGMARFNDDSMPVWIEDTWNTCECEECLAPFRMPDGSLIENTDPNFKTEWTIVNATAYNQMVRVYANRAAELNYLIYFYTIPVPRTPLTKYVRAHFCPYVRADYDQPIFAPVNDKFWRIITQWGQVARTVGVSDYFLGGNFRPSADVQQADLRAMREVGVKWFGQETESKDSSFTEMWVAQRMIWEPQWNPDALRAYYCEKVFGEGGEDIYNFYAKLRKMRYEENRNVDFEDWAEMGHLALNTPASKSKYDNLAEELTALLDRATKKTKNDRVASFFVEKVSSAWADYLKDAVKEIK